MIVNKKLKIAFQEMSEKAIEYANTPNKERRYLKRWLNIYKHHLTENEQLYILQELLEQARYRSIISDPDNVAQIYNMRLKTYTYIFLLSFTFLIVAGIIFRSHNGINNVIDGLIHVFKLLSV